MGRTKMKIDRAELETAIRMVEGNKGLANRLALHQAVAATPWAKERGISHSVVGLRIEEFGIQVKTPLGRNRTSKTTVEAPGTVSAAPVAAPQPMPMKTGSTVRPIKISEKPSFNVFDRLRKAAPSELYPTIERARKGDMKACIEINCARCVGFEDMEASIRGCVTNDCPFHQFRPYQNVTINRKETVS